MTYQRSESMERLLDAMNEARGNLVQALRAIAVDLEYGTLSGSGDSDSWDRELWEAMLHASDIQMQAGFLAIGVANYARQFSRKMDQYRDELEKTLECETAILTAHKEGVMVAINSMQEMLGEQDPMNLYEFYLKVINEIDRAE